MNNILYNRLNALTTQPLANVQITCVLDIKNFKLQFDCAQVTFYELDKGAFRFLAYFVKFLIEYSLCDAHKNVSGR